MEKRLEAEMQAHHATEAALGERSSELLVARSEALHQAEEWRTERSRLQSVERQLRTELATLRANFDQLTDK